MTSSCCDSVLHKKPPRVCYTRMYPLRKLWPLLLIYIDLSSAWISNDMPSKVWVETSYSFPNFIGCTVKRMYPQNNPKNNQRSSLLIWINYNPSMDSSDMPDKVWNENTYSFPNCNGYTVEVWEWMNFISHVITDAITYGLCLKLSHVRKIDPVSHKSIAEVLWARIGVIRGKHATNSIGFGTCSYIVVPRLNVWDPRKLWSEAACLIDLTAPTTLAPFSYWFKIT